MTTFGLYGARLSLAVWRHFTCYIYFFLYSVLSLKNKYTILYYTILLDSTDNKLTMFIHKYLFLRMKVIALQKPEMWSTFFWECFENGCGNIHPITFTVTLVDKLYQQYLWYNNFIRIV